MSQKEMKLVQQMKHSVPNIVMSYQKIYERKKRKEILKDRERSMVRGEEGRHMQGNCKGLLPQNKNFFPLIWVILNTQKSHKLPFT